MKKEDVDKMSLQEAMDYAVMKIVEQGGRCLYKEGDSCGYGDAEGRHCAVGWLLDEDDGALMGHFGGVTTLFSVGDIPQLIADNTEAFILLQEFHDLRNEQDRRVEAEELGEIYGIDTSGSHWSTWIKMGE